ncbi:MAG: prepilin-type N-terminal cleavage/methylation domain-containing protein [Pseudomonadota bacterium]|nr:MAG: prepilin-type N-terminal cleavage/methylation domain-containing protein [Pseudomonadota bacterium]
MTNKRPAGFTLLELLISISLLAILLVTAVPSFLDAIQNNRLTSQANEFVTAMQLARSEALKRNRPVTVCASDTSAETPSCGGAWTDGWIVATDANGAGDNSVSVSEILRVWPAVTGNSTITPSDSETFVRYLPRGEVDTAAATFPIVFQLRIPHCTRDSARDIRIVAGGRAIVERVEC